MGRSRDSRTGRGARWGLLSVGCAGVLVAGIALGPVFARITRDEEPRGAVVTTLEPTLPDIATQEPPPEASVASSPRRKAVGRFKGTAKGTGEAAAAVPRVDEKWVARTADAVGIPATAVRAYGRAVLGAPKGCELGWTTLAGIGWVESQHGTIGGRTLGDDGRSDTPVLGPALDGGAGLAAIRADAESSALHGDPVWDHAVGPMQFIPSTWARFARDGDGDGTADPHDIDDAAVAAAAYLCHDTRDLTTSAGWNAAIFSYNHDTGYVVAVHAAANRYGQLAG